MQPADIGLAVLLMHGALAAFDRLVNHELADPNRLPASALKLQAWRSLLYLLIFCGLAWFEWHGAFAALLTALVIAEFGLRLMQASIVERTRAPQPLELAGHIALGVTTGAWAGFVLHTALVQWAAASSRLMPIAYGYVSWLLTLAAAGAAVAALRDAHRASSVERYERYLPPASVRGYSRARGPAAG